MCIRDSLTATGSNLQWYSAASGGAALSGATALTTATYYVSQTVSGCESARTPVTVSLSSTAAPTANSPQSFCANTNPTVANLTATGSNLQWYSAASGGAALSGATALTTATYYVSQTVSGCESARTPVTVSLSSTAAPTANSPQSFCANTNPTVANLTATGSNLQWYSAASGGAALSGATALTTATYYVSQTVSGCESARTPVTVSLSSTAAPTANSPQSFCANTNPTVANLTATGSNLQWYSAASGGVALSGATALTTATYYVSQTVSGCESARTPVTVSLSSTAAPTANSPQSFCANTNPTVANLTATGSNLQWYSAASGGAALSGATALTTATYYVSQTVSGCESARTPVTVSLSSTAAPTANSPQSFCANTNPTVANLTATGSNLQWYSAASGGAALSGATALTTATYYVSQTVSGCESARTPVTVSLSSTAAPTANSPQSFCANTNPTVANLTATGSNLQWYSAASGGVALSGATALTTATYYVSQTVSGCESARTPVTVSLSSTAAPTANSPQSFCANTNPTVANLTATGSNLQWYSAASGGAALSGATALTTATYYVSQTVSGCESARTPVTVSLSSTAAPTANSPQSFCANTNPTVANLTATGSNLQWYSAASGGAALSGATALTTATYYVSQTVSGCESARTPVTVSLSSTAAPTANSPQSFCANTNPTVANLTATGSNLQWYSAASGGAALSGATALTTATYYVSQTVSGCESARTPVTVSVSSTAAPTANSPQSFCANTNPTVANLTATGSNLQWYSASSGGAPLSGATALTTATYYVSQTVSGCESARTPVTVSVSSTAAPTASSPQSFCANTNPTVSNLTATGSNLQWYSAASGGAPLRGATALTTATYY